MDKITVYVSGKEPFLQYDLYLKAQKMVNNNVGPKANKIRLHDLCLDVLKCAWKLILPFMSQGVPPTSTINVDHLT